MAVFSLGRKTPSGSTGLGYAVGEAPRPDHVRAIVMTRWPRQIRFQADADLGSRGADVTDAVTLAEILMQIRVLRSRARDVWWRSERREGAGTRLATATIEHAARRPLGGPTGSESCDWLW